jgi:hypothetical protein
VSDKLEVFVQKLLLKLLIVTEPMPLFLNWTVSPGCISKPLPEVVPPTPLHEVLAGSPPNPGELKMVTV